MPRVSKEHAERRRDQILQAASACIAQNGFHRTTMAHICDQAGLSPGSVYTWFPSKEAIIQEMTRRRLQDFRSALQTALEDPRQGAKLYVDTVKQAATNAEVGWMNIHLVADARRNRFARDALRKVTREGVTILKQASRRLHKGKRGQADARARLLQAAAFGIVIQSLIEPDGERGDFDLAIQLLMG